MYHDYVVSMSSDDGTQFEHYHPTFESARRELESCAFDEVERIYTYPVDFTTVLIITDYQCKRVYRLEITPEFPSVE